MGSEFTFFIQDTLYLGPGRNDKASLLNRNEKIIRTKNWLLAVGTAWHGSEMVLVVNFSAQSFACELHQPVFIG